MKQYGSWTAVVLVLLIVIPLSAAMQRPVVNASDASSARAYALYLPSVQRSYCACCTRPVLHEPADGSTGHSLIPVFRWHSGNDPLATGGFIEAARDPGFTRLAAAASSPSWAQGQIDYWHNVYNLQPGTTYWWRVRLECGPVHGPFSETWSFTTAPQGTIPTAPTLLSPSDGSTLVSLPVTVQWSPVEGAVEYLVSWRQSVEPGRTVWWVRDTQATLLFLEAGTVYEWYVEARSDYAMGAKSATWQFTTP
jgi:hypothetical protein